MLYVPELLGTEMATHPRVVVATTSSYRRSEMADAKKKRFDLGRDGDIICHVSEDPKRLLIEFDVDKEELTKTGDNGLIEALKKIRAMMAR
jgi:hypothetical protein